MGRWPRRFPRVSCARNGTSLSISHNRPYYGKVSQEEGLWVRGNSKDGTTHFYRVATAYVMPRGLRSTLRRFVESHRTELMERFIREDVAWGLHGDE